MWQQQRLPSTAQSVAMCFGSSPSLIPLLLVHPRLPSFPSASPVLLLSIIPGGQQAVRCDASCPDPADLHIPLRCPGTWAGSSSPGGCPEQVIMGCCHTQVHFKNNSGCQCCTRLPKTLPPVFLWMLFTAPGCGQHTLLLCSILFNTYPVFPLTLTIQGK